MSTFAELAIEFTSRTAAQAARDIRAVEGAAAGAEKAVDGLATSGKDLDASTGKATTGAKKLTDSLDRQRGGAKRATDEFYRMIGATNTATAANDRAAPATKRLTDSLYKMGGGARKATDGLADVGGASEKTSGILGKLAGMAGGAAGKLAALAAATFGFHQIITTLSSFEQEMAAVKAVSGATGDELKALRDTAKLLGATTEFSASQAAQGLKILTQAGYSARSAIATIPTVLDLATTESMDLGAATEYVNSIMAGFGLTVASAGRVADVLVYASNAASTGVAELGEGMKYVAPIARSLGINIEESAAAMGVLSDAGLKGTVAGTGLRSMMASLAAPSGDAAKAIGSLGLSLRDISPQSNSLTSIIAKLAGAGIDAGTAFRIFGTEAAPAVMALVANNDRLAEFVDNMSDIDGTAKRVADTMRDQLGGDIKGLASAVEGLIISMGDAGLTAALRVVIQAATSAARAISTMIDMVSGAAKWIGEATGISWAFRTAVKAISETMGGLQGYVIAASVAIGARFAPAIVGAMASAVGAVGAFTASLVTLRGALITTGIGAVVVAAGYLINKFLDLVTATGGFGEAMSLLGEVAAGVWEGIKTSAASIPVGLNAIWENVKAGFYSMISGLVSKWQDFLIMLSGSVAGVPGMDEVSGKLMEYASKASSDVASFERAATAAIGAAKALEDQAAGMASSGFDKAKEALEKLNVTVTTTTDALGGTGTGAGTGTAGGLSGAATGAGKATDELRKEVERLNKAAAAGRTPVEKYRAELEKLEKLKKLGLSDAAYAMELERINEELANGIPIIGDMASAWGDFVAGGFKDFKGFVKNVLGSFRQMLSEMIATAGRNKIIIGMGLGGTGAGAAVAGGVSAPGGMGSLGILGNIGGAIGGVASAFFGGAMNSLGALFSGGFGAMFTSVGAQVGTALATGTLSSIAGSIGAVLGPIALIGVAISALIGKTKLLNKGIAVTVDGFDALVETFQTTQKSRLFGLIKSRAKTAYAPADAALADPITATVAQIQSSILNMASTLGVGAKAFKDFSYLVEVSTMNMSDDEAARAIQEALLGVSDAFAGMVVGLGALRRDGETTTEALTRLSQSLVAVNQVFDTLDYRLRYAGLAGADMASQLADLLGGVEGFISATSGYYETFYSEAERAAIMTRQATAALADFGTALPRTRDAYRALIDAQDLTTEGGRALWAALVSLSGVMDQILPSVSSLTAALASLQGNVATGLDGAIAAATTAAQANARAAADWYKAAGSIRDYIDRLRGSETALTNAFAALTYNQTRYQTTLASALAGDLTAAQNMTSVAENLRQSVRATARTRTEAALAEARILSDLGLLGGVADVEGARHDVIAGLLTQQAELLTEVRDFIAAGGALDEAMITTLKTQLGSLDEAIAAAQLINYAYLKERLAVTVDVLADADVPAYLKTLLGNAATGVTGYVDFLVRSDLSPDLKWLALTGASEHIATIEYLAKNKLGKKLTGLALETVSSLQKTVNLLVGKKLPEDVLRIALAGNSELSRTVTATLSAKIDKQAKILALGNVGAYAVAVTAALKKKDLGDDVRRLVLAQQGDYAAMIRGAVSEKMSDRARRILLTQQGGYVANITGVLVSNMNTATRRLLLEANTKAARAVTVSMAFADSVSKADRRLLRDAAAEIDRTVRAAVDLAGLSKEGALFLTQIGLGKASVQKGVVGSIVLGALSDDQRRLLRSVDDVIQRTLKGKADVSGLTGPALSLLNAATGTVTRTLKGAVDLSGLNARQKSLLDAINGATSGQITLGGSFLFDPSAGFKTWFETSTRTSIATPMDAVRTAMGALGKSLDDLAKAMAAETARARHESTVAALNSYVSGLQTDAKGNVLVDDAILGKMAGITGQDITGKSAAQVARMLARFSDTDLFETWKMDQNGLQRLKLARAAAVGNLQAIAAEVISFDASTGGFLANGSTATSPQVVAGRLKWSAGDPDSVFGANASDLAQWRSHWWNAGGLQDRLWAADQAVGSIDKQIAAFAAGGWHGGGLRIVGENGPEIEATGPARYYSATQTRSLMSGGEDMAAELRALRKEVARLREEQRGLGMTQATAARRSHEILRRWDDAGLPKERV